MKEWNENIGAQLPWHSESGSWLSLPIPWLPSSSQADVPPWSLRPETDRPAENDPVAEDSIGEMASAVHSSKAEDDSNEIGRHGNRIATAAYAHPISLEVMSGETFLEEGTKTDLMVSDVKELTDNGGAKGSCLQGDTVSRSADLGTLTDLGLAKQAKPVPENVSVVDQSCGLLTGKEPDPGMDQLEPSSGACLTMSLSMFSTKDTTGEGTDTNEQGGSSAPVGLTSSVGQSGEVRDNAKLSGMSSIRHRQRQILPKPPHSQQSTRTETARETSPQAPVRVARPPGEGRGRNQLLPRYWPRITDQELQQITSGDSNCTITPLFEKMLSASDAGRIGRLVLPKACAEAYFPPISQPEGLPLKIQDVSGKDWVFQFRFWPNNNSRMYVLEGVTPCIQSMNLQAGDTVTFSRLDPEGKLVMGYRRAPNSFSPQDTQPGMGSTTTAPLSSGGIENLTSIASFASLLPQCTKVSADIHMNGQSNLSDTGYGWYKTEKAGPKAKESSFLQSLAGVDRKRGRHLGSKSKRLRLEVEDSIELKLSWEEAQELLRPPPNVAPSILTIEGHEFEEYEEPPVFGKRTIFTTRQNGGGEDQWAQCDDCGSWRRVPSDVFLPMRWTCSDNVWDPKRATCTAPQEVNSEEIDNLLRRKKEVRKADGTERAKGTEASSGLDALATAATLGENNTASSSSPAPTTKHPRHRPGCTCIVCIQPPSGKGPKHKPTCVCNVCMTVKRRFKTLMMRRKKRQSEREAENARKKRGWIKEEEVSSGTKWQTDHYSFHENGSKPANIAPALPGGVPRINNPSSNGNRFSPNAAHSSSYSSKHGSVGEERVVGKGQIDLNSQPEREDEPGKGTGRMSMVRLLQSATYPLDRYLKQQGLTSLICPQQIVSSNEFARNVGSRRVDELAGSQSAVLNPERPQDEAYFMLGREKGDTATSIQSYDVMERKLVLQVSTQGS